MTSSNDDPRTGLARQELALLAHEVRGALTIVVGMSELLRRELSNEDRDRALEGISRAVSRIDRLLDEAMGGELTTARPAEKIDLAALAEQVVAEQRAVSQRQIDVIADHRPVVTGAREALERALSNLIENGLKYSLASTPVEVRVTESDGIARLEVSDRGPGIAASEKERVFEPFHRIEGESAPGTGLGLTVVRSVAEAHGGCAHLEDRPGGGSVFSIRLPVPGV